MMLNSRSNGQLRQSQETQYPPKPDGQYSPVPPYHIALPWQSTDVQTGPLGIPTALTQYPGLDSVAVAGLLPEAPTAMPSGAGVLHRQFPQHRSTQSLHNSDKGHTYRYQPSNQTRYSASVDLSSARPPQDPSCDENIGPRLQHHQSLPPSPYQGRNQSPWKQHVLDNALGLHDAPPLFYGDATMDMSRTFEQDPRDQHSDDVFSSRSPSTVHQTIESPCISPALLSLTPIPYSPVSSSPEKAYQQLHSPFIQSSYYSTPGIQGYQPAAWNGDGISPAPTQQKKKGRAQAIKVPLTDMDVMQGATPRSASERVKAFSTGDQTCHSCYSRLLIRARGDHYYPHYCITCLETKILYTEEEEAESSFSPNKRSPSGTAEPGSFIYPWTEFAGSSAVMTPTKNREATCQAVGSSAVTPTKNKKGKQVGKDRLRSPIKPAFCLTRTREVACKANSKSTLKTDERMNDGKSPRKRNVRCMEHRGRSDIEYPIIDSCVGCRLCSAGSRVYQLLSKKRPYIPYTRKNITAETKKLRRWKEFELIAYLNGNDECHAQIERAQGSEQYQQMMGEIEKAGGLLPALPWL